MKSLTMHKIMIAICLVVLLNACNLSNEKQKYSFYLGTYTNESSEGIYQSALNTDGSFDSLQLKAKTTSPSFLSFAHNKDVLLAVNEVNIDGSGVVESYQINQTELTLKGRSSSGGAHPCHVITNEAGEVLVSNYSGGNIGYLNVEANGNLSALLDVGQHLGKGPTNRQTKPHAHSSWFIPNSNMAITVDLGIDQLVFYSIENHDLIITDSVMLESGAGPRHLSIHPTKELLYVINELNSTVSVIKMVDDSWTLLNSFSTLPNDYKGQNSCADIHISNDGRFLYASNRGHNSIAVFSIDNSGEVLKPIAHESVNGDWPRNFSLTPDNRFVVVANQNSNNLVSYSRNAETGLLSYLNEIKIDSPVCVLFE